MILTDQHISAERIIAAIEWIETPMWLRKTELQTDDVKSALLEVLQRRAEDRTASGANTNDRTQLVFAK